VNRPLAIGLLGATLAAAACGGGGGVTGVDGGASDGSVSVETLPPGWSAFDVTAAIALKPVAGVGDWRAFPKTHAFTFVWHPVAGQLIVGGGGAVSPSAVVPHGGLAFRTMAPVSVAVPYPDSCGGLAALSYDEIIFSYDGALHGTARGHATYQTGDQLWTAEVTATLEGVADATPPTPKSAGGAIDPLEPFTLAMSEPLPPTATATLRGTKGGDVVPLEAGHDLSDDAFGFFLKPAVALAYEEVYTLVTDGLVDFAGLRAAPASTIALRTGAPPPLARADGFESVTTQTFGGAGVLHGGPLTPLAGDTSLILNTGFGGGFGFLPYHLGPTMALRLAVPAGATVVRFTTQLVATYDLPQASFYGDIRVGSPGGALAVVANVEAKDFVKVTLPVDGDVYLSPLSTIEVPLPAGTKDELVFEIVGNTGGCGLPPPPTALIVDDLRVE
jgi:hypothetical protein